MAYHQLDSLRVLIVDDFDSFRSTLGTILRNMGIHSIDSVADGEDALEAVKKNSYDLILCDYNLGRGKNGQQVLEDLRHYNLLEPGQMFILLSTESSKNIVLASYDAQPDAYLTKPITAKTIEQRLTRLLLQRDSLQEVYAALKLGKLKQAIAAGEAALAKGGRAAVTCQKLLGELYLQAGLLTQAQDLYTHVLEARSLDWAEVGLANVRLAQNDFPTAEAWLRQVLARNPMCMAAYDSLAKLYQRKGDVTSLQAVLAEAVEISPIAILRQQQLARVARDNFDVPVAAKAYQQAVKLGDNSCYHTVADVLDFGRMSAELFSVDEHLARGCADDAINALTHVDKRFNPLEKESQWQAYLTQARLLVGKGDTDQARKVFAAAQTAIEQETKGLALDTSLDLAQSMFALDDRDSAQKLLAELVEKYQDDQSALKRIDRLLDEPVSRDSRSMVAQINQEGIAYYKQKRFREAVGFFRHAHQLFPHHMGITLNLLQSLIGELSQFGLKADVVAETDSLISEVYHNIKPTHAQFGRFRQLQEMLASVKRKPGSL